MSTHSTAPDTPAGVRQRNPRGEGGRLRADILAAAGELLDETGEAQSVTLRAVARRVGVAAPSIYGHFPDRQAIMLVLVQEAFAELGTRLLTAAEAGSDPVSRLRAICEAYLLFADVRRERYRVMFEGVWNATEGVDTGAISVAEAAQLGQDAIRVLVASLQECVDAGRSSSTDAFSDAVALWVGLHGLAHQRAVSRAFPWPPDIAERVIDPLAHLVPGATRRTG